jgi:K+-sensing histidine kinase KdpD
MSWQVHPADQALRLAGICVCVAASTLLVHVLLGFGINAVYLPFLPPVALCCLVDGLGSGLAATALCGLALWYFYVPPEGFALPDAAHALHLFVFVAVSAFMCWVIHLQRRSNQQLMEENFELGYKVGLLRELRAARGQTAR